MGWLEDGEPIVLKPTITVCTVAGWLMVMMAITRRETWKEGVVSWIFSSATMLILFSFAIKGLSLDGSGYGLSKAFVMFFGSLGNQLKDVEIWLDALGQV